MRFQDGSDLLSPFGVKLLLLFMCLTGEQGYCSVLPPLAHQGESPGLHPGQFDRGSIHLGGGMREVGLRSQGHGLPDRRVQLRPESLIALFPLRLPSGHPHVR